LREGKHSFAFKNTGRRLSRLVVMVPGD